MREKHITSVWCRVRPSAVNFGVRYERSSNSWCRLCCNSPNRRWFVLRQSVVIAFPLDNGVQSAVSLAVVTNQSCCRVKTSRCNNIQSGERTSETVPLNCSDRTMFLFRIFGRFWHIFVFQIPTSNPTTVRHVVHGSDYSSRRTYTLHVGPLIKTWYCCILHQHHHGLIYIRQSHGSSLIQEAFMAQLNV